MMSRLESLSTRITPTLFLLLAIGGALLVVTPRRAGADPNNANCKPNRATCTADHQCCSGACTAGLCATPPTTTIPGMTLYIDPCRRRCAISLCRFADGLHQCSQPCDPDGYRLDVPQSQDVVVDAMGAKIRIFCAFDTPPPCFTCTSDAECDDGNPATIDVCYPPGDMFASCRNACAQ